uniref:DUF5591 domain-containing protein n=1 Tax=Dictyoglomus turgidum TaxID=513050 RepID=A0A7C3SMM2_9BACT
MNLFNSRNFYNSISKSRNVTTSLVGDEKEIIPPNEWDLGPDSPLLHPVKEHFYHPHPERAFQFVLDNFKPLHDIVLFTNCTAKKPYSTTHTYKKIIGATKPYDDIYDLVTISSIGVIPTQYEKYYPFAHYAWDDNHRTPEEIKKVFYQVIGDRVKKFLEKFDYKYVIGVFRVTSKGKKALKYACDQLNKPLIEIPSEITFEKIKDNLMKMNVFQLLNSETLGELNDVLSKLSKGVHVDARKSWTPEQVKDAIRKRQKEIKELKKQLMAEGKTKEEIYEMLYGGNK